MHTASYKFFMKPKESAGCHQTLSARVGSGDETTPKRSGDLVKALHYHMGVAAKTRLFSRLQ